MSLAKKILSKNDHASTHIPEGPPEGGLGFMEFMDDELLNLVLANGLTPDSDMLSAIPTPPAVAARAKELYNIWAKSAAEGIHILDSRMDAMTNALGGPHGNHLSLVQHRLESKGDSAITCDFIKWKPGDTRTGQRIFTDTANRAKFSMFHDFPYTELVDAVTIHPDIGILAPAAQKFMSAIQYRDSIPSGIVRLKRMWQHAMKNDSVGATIDICACCNGAISANDASSSSGSSAAPPPPSAGGMAGMTCALCCMTFHFTCLDTVPAAAAASRRQR